MALTQTKSATHDDVADATRCESSDVVDAVDVRVVQLEDADHVVRPGRNYSYRQQANHARNQAQCVECEWNGQDSKPDLRLHHEEGSAHPANLSSSQRTRHDDATKTLPDHYTYVSIIGATLSYISENCIMDRSSSMRNRVIQGKMLFSFLVVQHRLFVRHSVHGFNQIPGKGMQDREYFLDKDRMEGKVEILRSDHHSYV